MRYNGVRTTLLGVMIGLTVASMATASGEWRVSIEGQKSGWFAGETSLRNEAHPATSISDFSFEILSPRDPQSGLPTGQRIHKPIVFQVAWGAITPQLQQAIASNENIKTIVFEYWKPQLRAATGVGEMELEQVITLTNANIADIRHHTLASGTATRTTTARRGVEVEDVSVTYQKITIENKHGTTTAQDDWEART